MLVSPSSNVAGTSLMLEDASRRYFYKHSAEQNRREYEFYRAVWKDLGGKRETSLKLNSYDAGDVSSIENEGLNDNSLYEELQSAADYRLIPQFFGEVSLERTLGGGFEVKQKASKSCLQALQLEHLLSGMKSPSVGDFKLGNQYIGVHRDDPFYESRKRLDQIYTTSESRNEIVSLWRSEKKRIRAEMEVEEAERKIWNLEPGDLGVTNLDLPAAEFRGVLKSWRQEAVAGSTTQDVLGYRVCGLRYFCKDKNGMIFLDREWGLSSSAEEVSSQTERFLRGCDIRKLLPKLCFLRNWLKYQKVYRFYASSLLIYYDQERPSSCDVHLIDFAHAIRDEGRASNDSLVFGLDVLLDIAKNIYYHERKLSVRECGS